jgi:hypothetical protein
MLAQVDMCQNKIIKPLCGLHFHSIKNTWDKKPVVHNYQIESHNLNNNTRSTHLQCRQYLQEVSGQFFYIPKLVIKLDDRTTGIAQATTDRQLSYHFPLHDMHPVYPIHPLAAC